MPKSAIAKRGQGSVFDDFMRRQLLLYLHEHIKLTGAPPSLAQVGARFRVSGTAIRHQIYAYLIEAGWVEVEEGNRSLQLTAAGLEVVRVEQTQTRARWADFKDVVIEAGPHATALIAGDRRVLAWRGALTQRLQLPLADVELRQLRDVRLLSSLSSHVNAALQGQLVADDWKVGATMYRVWARPLDYLDPARGCVLVIHA